MTLQELLEEILLVSDLHQFKPQAIDMASVREVEANEYEQSEVYAIAGDVLRESIVRQIPHFYLCNLRAVSPWLLEKCYPEFFQMIGLEQPYKWHPEGDVWNHTMEVVERMIVRNHWFATTTCITAALFHDVGKIRSENPPKHSQHEIRGFYMMDRLFERYGFKNSHFNLELIKYVVKYHGHMHKLKEMKPVTLFKMFDAMGANKPDYLSNLVDIMHADSTGRSFLSAKNSRISEELSEFDMYIRNAFNWYGGIGKDYDIKHAAEVVQMNKAAMLYRLGETP